MKKIWNLMLVALVILGAAACTENVDSVDLKSEGVSFYATIGDEDTRAYIEDENGDKKWNTVWENGDILDVTVDGETLYTFTYNSTTGKFSSNDEGVTSLIGENVKILSQTGGNRDSKAGKKAWAINTTTVDNFTNNATVKLEASTSFFRYTYEGDSDVTFEVVVTDENIDPKPCVFQYGGDSYESVTIPAGVKGENFVGFWPQGNDIEAKLSYSIGGVKCKETTLNLRPGKVYNLGTLEGPKIYFVPNDDWKQAEAWFSAHFFNSNDESADVKLTDENTDGIYECFVPDGMEKVLFCRMNPAHSEFGWNTDDDNTHVWNQTGEHAIGVAPNNYYYILDWTSGMWGTKDGYVRNFGVVGIGGNWDNDKIMTLDGDYHTLTGVAIAEADEFKIRVNGSWDESYGMGGEATVTITKDTKLTLVKGGQNMKVEAGTYDLYFSDKTKDFFVMTPGTTPADLEKPIVWVLTGTFNEWNETACIMTKTATDNLFVAEDIELKSGDEIKVKDSTTWDTSYGGGITNLNANSWMKAYFNGSNIGVAKSGTYDVYFEYIKDGEFSKMYLMEADADHSTATEQTENGALIPDETPEVTPTDLVLGIVTSKSDWDASAALEMVAYNDAHAYFGLELAEDETFKIVKDSSMDVNYGYNSTIDTNENYTLVEDGSGIQIGAAGAYNVYFNYSTKVLTVKAATAYDIFGIVGGHQGWNTASRDALYLIPNTNTYVRQSVTLTAEGFKFYGSTTKTVTVEHPATTTGEEGDWYLVPNSNWKKDNARFAIYFFGDEGDIWVDMKDDNGDDIYVGNTPNNGKNYKKMIFCRMNPNAAANNWNNKWNQTGDLTIPTNSNNCFTVPSGSWDGATSSWSVHTPEVKDAWTEEVEEVTTYWIGKESTDVITNWVTRWSNSGGNDNITPDTSKTYDIYFSKGADQDWGFEVYYTVLESGSPMPELK